MLSRTLDVDGGPVHLADFGGTGPTMILVHGLGGSHANWLAVGPGLAAHARVLAPDLPGFGRTPLAGRSARVRANVELLDRLLDAVDGGPAVLVGNSMGGLIAMMEAAARPEKVAALVLVGPAQPRPRGALLDPAVALTFAAYAFPGVGERFLRWRAAWLGPERLVRQTLALCCADPASVPPDVVAAHVALARERERMPWSQPAVVEPGELVADAGQLGVAQVGRHADLQPCPGAAAQRVLGYGLGGVGREPVRALDVARRPTGRGNDAHADRREVAVHMLPIRLALAHEGLDGAHH